MAIEWILVVDDSPTQLTATRAVLEEQGYRVQARSNGEQGLEAAHGQRFAVILTDVVMPGISGFELCKRIKQEVVDPPPVILLTSLNDPRDLVRGIECGADGYVTKPYPPEQLAARVARVIEDHGARSGVQGGPISVRFLGESYSISSDPSRILGLLLSSFEELIHANVELRASKRKAEAAARARDDVLATVSHDLRNPVGAIFGSASLLLDIPLAVDAQKRQFELIKRNAAAMERLIQDLLDVASIDAGSLSTQARPESAHALLSEACDLLASIARARDIELVPHLAGPDVEVVADRQRVVQVFSNLVGNAAKFTPAGGRVTLGAVREGAVVRYTVADTGPGIPAADLPHIFDRFWRGQVRGGAGLGLAIVKGIVEAHGGTIEVASTGAGATFSFTLPIVGR